VKWRIALIVLAGALAYANALNGPFIFDDESTVLDNKSIHDGSLTHALNAAREITTAGRPLVNLTFAANYALGGIDVRGYHVVNIALHLACGLLVFGCARRTLQGRSIPIDLRERSADLGFAAALLWTVHPLNSEVVDYLTQRTESMMALCYLLTLYASIRAWTNPHAARWQVRAVLSCACGMACKESMVTAPVMVFLYDRAFGGASWADALRRRWRFYGCLAATWAVLIAVLWSGPRVYTTGFSTAIDPWTYLLNQTVMLTRYLRLAIWPRSLVLAYGIPQPLTLGDVLPYALFIVGLLLGSIASFIRWPRIGFLGAWFFVTLAPTSSFVPIATEVGAERRMYLPMAAMAAYATAAVWHLWSTRTRGRLQWAPAAVLATIAALLGLATLARNREYESPLRMAGTVLARWPSSFARVMVGNQLALVGRHDEAIAYLREAAPTYALAAFHLGGELFNQGKPDEAIAAMQDFVRREPMRLEAVRARTILARAFMLQRKWDPAAEQLRQVLEMTRDGTSAHTMALGFMADTRLSQQRFDEAVVYYRAYLARALTDVGAATNLGIALAASGHAADARLAFQRAVEIDPRDANARRNLVKALLNENDTSAALSEIDRLIRLYPDDAIGHDLLGRALAAQGRLDEASEEFESVLKRNPRDEQARQDLAMVAAARRGQRR